MLRLAENIFITLLYVGDINMDFPTDLWRPQEGYAGKMA